MYYSPFLSLLKIIIFFVWTLICSSIQFLLLLTPKNIFFLTPKLYFKGLIFIFGIDIRFKGVPKKENVIYISNHSSYLDIFILGSKLDGLFVAKSEIANWPIINKICKLAKTIFINRNKKSNTKNQIAMINKFLVDGFNIILFPEGTSNDGNKVLPFKSSLFAITELNRDKNYFIQPISLSYTGFDGVPLSRFFKHYFAWYGNMDLVPHVWKLLGMGNCEIEVKYHAPKAFNEFFSRKEACKYCFELISSQVSKDLNANTRENLINLYNYKYL